MNVRTAAICASVTARSSSSSGSARAALGIGDEIEQPPPRRSRGRDRSAPAPASTTRVAVGLDQRDVDAVHRGAADDADGGHEWAMRHVRRRSPFDRRDHTRPRFAVQQSRAGQTRASCDDQGERPASREENMLRRQSAPRSAAGLIMAGAASATAQALEVAIDQSPAGLDPHIVTAFSSFMVVNGTIYEGLTAIDKDLKVRPEPRRVLDGLAGRQDLHVQAPLGRHLPRRLRDGRGRRRRHGPARASRRRSPRRCASRLASVESATASDPQTVELKLKEPSAPLLVRARHHRDRAERGRDQQGRAAEARRSAPARSSSRNGSRTASSCSPSMTATGSRARRSSRASSSTSCRNRRPGRSASSTGSTRCCPTSTRRPRCS